MKCDRIIALCVFLFLVACSTFDYEEHLKEVESRVSAEPMSALADIRTLSSDYPRMTAKEKAHYSLLYAMALDKSYVDTTDTSVLAAAVEYYTKKGSPREKMLTYYYLGRIQGNAHNYSESLLSLTYALDQRCEDPSYQGRIYLAMADAHNASYNFGEEAACVDSAAFYFAASGDSLLMRASSYRKAVSQINLGNYSEAKTLLDQLLDKQDLEFHMLRSCLLQRAYIAALSHDESHFTDAIDWYAKALEMGAMLNEKHAGAYAYLLYETGDKETGEGLFNTLDSMGASGQAISDSWRSRICNQEGLTSEAFRLQERALSYQDSVVVAALSQSLIVAQRNYYANNCIKERQYSELLEKRQTIIYLLIVLAGILLFWVIIIVRRIHRRRTSLFESTLETLRSELLKHSEAGNVSQKEFASLQDQFKRVYHHHFDILARFFEEYDIQRRNSVPEEKRNRQIHQIIDGLRGAASSDDRFEKIVDEDMNGLITRFREDYPGFSSLDIRLFCYYVAGFSTKTISIIVQGLSADAIYMRKSRMKKEIEKSENPRRFQYLEYL